MLRADDCVLSPDLDGDGDLDAVVVHDVPSAFQAPAMVRTWLNAGDGTFVVQAERPVAWHPRSVRVADIDTDGDLDVVATEVDVSSLVVLRGDGAGGLAPAEYFGLDRPSEAATGDLDGDGRLDVVGLSAEFGRGSILMNRGSGAASP